MPPKKNNKKKFSEAKRIEMLERLNFNSQPLVKQTVEEKTVSENIVEKYVRHATDLEIVVQRKRKCFNIKCLLRFVSSRIFCVSNSTRD